MRLSALEGVAKRCPDCKKLKGLGEFYVMDKPNGTRSTRCRPCHIARGVATRRLNPENSNRSARDRFRFKRYGLTYNDMVRLLEAQAGCCAVCGRGITLETRGCHVDHDHARGIVRGLLCPNCNWIIGHSFENPETLRAAALYVERHRHDS